MQDNIGRPLRAIFASRKAVLFIFVVLLIGFAAFGFTVIILRSAWRGEMSIEHAMIMVFSTMMIAIYGATKIGNTLINAIKDEKIAKIVATAPPKPAQVTQVSQGDMTNVTKIVDAPSPSSEAITDPQTPSAKKDL